MGDQKKMHVAVTAGILGVVIIAFGIAVLSFLNPGAPIVPEVSIAPSPSPVAGSTLGGDIYQTIQHPAARAIPETNPFVGVDTNPLVDVYRNPFE